MYECKELAIDRPQAIHIAALMRQEKKIEKSVMIEQYNCYYTESTCGITTYK